MDRWPDFLTSYGTLIRSTLVIVVAFVVLGVINRVMQRRVGIGSGRRFRYQLTMFCLSLFLALMVILSLPIGHEMRGQLLSLFGIVVSATIALSAPSLLSNAMAGIMLKTIRNFRSGDFITVGEHFGRVSERGLFHTEIQKPDRDLTTLPNLMLATSPVTVIRSSGTVVSATCSLGYDVHHAKVEKVLLQAVQEAGLDDPFVQILEIGDFSITYKAAGILKDVKILLSKRSHLRAAMIDGLHDAGIEVLSPSVRNIRSYPDSRVFVPVAAQQPAQAAPEGAPIDVVFDKAESAEGEERLESQRNQVESELKQAREDLKQADAEVDRSAQERHVEALQRRLDHLDAAIACRKEEQKGAD
jgi:small-conductance mechanosensitive channel